MESLIRAWDGESVIIRFDRSANAWIFIAIHSTRLGPAVGGTRMKSYSDLKEALRDAQRLAGGMTLKWAAAGIKYGGGKCVIAVPSDLNPQARTRLLRRYGAFVHQHNGVFYTGPDYGTSSEDMDIIAEAGAPYIFGRTQAAGGAGNPGPFTALGVLTSIKVATERIFGEAGLAGKRVLVQGVGSVGRALINMLHETGADILISDVDEAPIEYFKSKLGLKSVPHDAAYNEPCDIFVPCAIGGVLNKENIPSLKCQAVVGAANNQLGDPADAISLRDREILYVPDFIANSGGAIAIIGMEISGWSQEEAEKRVIQTIRENLSNIFELSETAGCSMDEAASRIADMRLTAQSPV
jgi:leucine dehydrogenase